MPTTISVRPILPPRNFMVKQYKQLEKELRQYMSGRLQRDVLKALYATTDGWSSPPRFSAAFTTPRGRSEFWLTVRPSGRGALNWVRVSRGTHSRSIYGKGKPMRFQAGYTPKTTAGGQYGGSGQRHGAWRRTWVVNNHKIEARHFEEKVVGRFEKPFTTQVNRIVRRVFYYGI